PRGDEELPVRRLEQQHLPAHLLDDASQQRHLPPAGAPGEPPELLLHLVDRLPGPFRVFVHPDAVVPALAPGSFQQRDRLLRMASGGGGSWRLAWGVMGPPPPVPSRSTTWPSHCGPSYHQWPKSSASNGLHNTPGRPSSCAVRSRTWRTRPAKCSACARVRSS